jgi:hypothetical protein
MLDGISQTRREVCTVSEPERDGKKWPAPYSGYETLANFFDKKIGDAPVPPRVDRHFLDNYAGSVRPVLIATLKTMGMLDENNLVLEPLREAVRGGGDVRKMLFRGWAEDFYAEQIVLGQQHATAQMLWESFTKRSGYTGSTLRRAVLFYLALAKDVGLPISAHFKAPKAAPSSPKPPRLQSHPANPEKPAAHDDHISQDGAKPEQRDVTLGSAGTVSITVSVRWLDLTDDQFTKLRKLIKDIEALGEPSDDGGTSAPVQAPGDAAHQAAADAHFRPDMPNQATVVRSGR